MSFKPCTICSAQREDNKRCPGCGATEAFLNWWFSVDEIKIVNRLKDKAVFDIDKAYAAGLAAIHRIAVGHGISIEEAAVKHINKLRGELGI